MNETARRRGKRITACLLAIAMALTNTGTPQLAYAVSNGVWERAPQRLSISVSSQELQELQEERENRESQEFWEAAAMETAGMEPEMAALYLNRGTDADADPEYDFSYLDTASGADADQGLESGWGPESGQWPELESGQEPGEDLYDDFYQIENANLPYSEEKNEALRDLLYEELDQYVLVKMVENKYGETEAVIFASADGSGSLKVYTLNGDGRKKDYELTLPGLEVERAVEHQYYFDYLTEDEYLEQEEKLWERHENIGNYENSGNYENGGNYEISGTGGTGANNESTGNYEEQERATAASASRDSGAAYAADTLRAASISRNIRVFHTTSAVEKASVSDAVFEGEMRATAANSQFKEEKELYILEKGTDSFFFDDGDITEKINDAFLDGEPYVYSVGAGEFSVMTAETTETEEERFKAWVDNLFGPNGVDVFEISLTMSPRNGETVKAGQEVSWLLDLKYCSANTGDFEYTALSGNKYSVYDNYKNSTIKVMAPKGIVFTNAVTTGSTHVIKSEMVQAENGEWEERSVIQITLRETIPAGSESNITFSLSGKIEGNGQVPIGTEYHMKKSDVTYHTEITTIDRASGGKEGETYEINRPMTMTEEEVKPMWVVSGTDDQWGIYKEKGTPEFKLDGDEVVASYELMVALTDGDGFQTEWDDYMAKGRVPFATNADASPVFCVTETPTAVCETDSNKEIYPISMTVTPKNFTGDAVTVTGNADQPKALTAEITSFATPKTVLVEDKDMKQRLEEAFPDADPPLYSTYDVEVRYNAQDFTSNFYDIKECRIKNQASITYALAKADGAVEEKTVESDAVAAGYQIIIHPAKIQLNKMIETLSHGGDYITGTAELPERFKGKAVFSLLPVNEDGQAVEGRGVYIQVSNDDGSETSGKEDSSVDPYVNKKFVEIDPERITYNRGKVTLYEKDDNKEYTFAEEVPQLYVPAGSYCIQETDNKIEDTIKAGITAKRKIPSTSGTQSEELELTGDDKKGYVFQVSADDEAVITARNSDQKGGVSFTKIAANYTGTTQSGALANTEFGIYKEFKDAVAAQEAAKQKAEGTSVLSDGENAQKEKGFFGKILALFTGERAPEKAAVPDAEQTQKSNAIGLVEFKDLTAGTYYICELSTPDGYLLDEGIYKVTVEGNKNTTKLIPMIKGADGQWTEDADKTQTIVQNRQNKAGIIFRKWLMTLRTNSSEEEGGEGGEDGEKNTRAAESSIGEGE